MDRGGGVVASGVVALSRAVWWAPHVRRTLEARARFEEAEHLPPRDVVVVTGV